MNRKKQEREGGLVLMLMTFSESSGVMNKEKTVHVNGSEDKKQTGYETFVDL